MILFSLMAVCMSFGVGYVVMKTRRHPDKNAPTEHLKVLVGLPLLACSFWLIWWILEGSEWLALGALATAASAVWAPICLRDRRAFGRGGSEALLAMAGGPGAQHRDLWELCYRGEQWLLGRVPKCLLIYMQMIVVVFCMLHALGVFRMSG